MGRHLWLALMALVGVILAFHLAPGAIAAPTVKGDVAGVERDQRRFQQTPRAPFVPVEDSHGWRNHDHRVRSAQLPRNRLRTSVVRDLRRRKRDCHGKPARISGRRVQATIRSKPASGVRSLGDHRRRHREANPDTSIGGVPVHPFSCSGHTAMSRVISGYSGDVYINAVTGLPQRVIFKNTGPLVKNTSTTDYYDYGTKITITPPC